MDHRLANFIGACVFNGQLDGWIESPAADAMNVQIKAVTYKRHLHYREIGSHEKERFSD